MILSAILLFYALQTGASAYALWRGGAPERIVALALLIAAVTTTLLPHSAASYRTVFWAEFWIDLVLLGGLVVLAAFADRFWPLWLASLHLVSVANHGVRVYDPSIVPYAYWLLTGKLAYPMLAVLIAGTYRHAQRQRAGLPEYDWTRQRTQHR